MVLIAADRPVIEPVKGNACEATAQAMPTDEAPPGMADPWVMARQSLKFTLGGYCFFEFPFQAWVVETPLTVHLGEGTSGDLLAVDQSRWPSPCVIRSLPIREQLPRFLVEGGYLRYAPVQYERYYVTFDGTFPAYLSKFSSKSRKNLTRNVRKIARLNGGRVNWHEYRTAVEMAEFYRIARGLSKKTYQERLLDIAFSQKSEQELCALASQDAVRGYGLFHDGEAIAVALCRCYGNTILYDWIGYDPKYKRYSPGSALLLLMLEKLFSEGRFRYLDFGEGSDWYKKFFANGVMLCARVYFFPLRFAVLAVVLLHAGSNQISNFVGALLDRFRLRHRIRRFVRQRAMACRSI